MEKFSSLLVISTMSRQSVLFTDLLIDEMEHCVMAMGHHVLIIASSASGISIVRSWSCSSLLGNIFLH